MLEKLKGTVLENRNPVQGSEAVQWQDNTTVEGRIPVYANESVLCNPRTEYIVEATIPDIDNDDNLQYVFIPDKENLAKREIIAANTIVKQSKGKIPVRIYSSHSETHRLHEGTRLGYLELIDTNEISCRLNMMETEEQISRTEFLKKCTLPSEENEIHDLLWAYSDVFSNNKMDIGRTNIEHEIDTGSTKPIIVKPRRVPQTAEREVEKQIKDMLHHGIIRESTSPWSFPIVVVRKKNGDLRLCIDYRQLNIVTKRPVFPIPDCNEIFDTLGGSKFFSCLDLSQGYHQVPMAERDKCKTAFAVKSGQYEYNVMPFGLSGAPCTFQRVMHTVLREEVWEKCVIYLDDVLIFGRSIDEHNVRLKAVLAKFRQANLKLSPSKCQFLQQEVKYLGHVINENGVATDPEKIKKVVEWPTPTCHEQLQAFLGLCNYYRRFIQDYSKVTNPLWKIVTIKPFVWNEEAEDAFLTLKNC